MKKILTHLTGIVFLITILAAGACNRDIKKEDPPKEEKTPAIVEDDQTKVATPDRKPKAVKIYLEDILIDGRIHLQMSNEKHPDRKVIDDLVTIVYPGDTVIWRKGSKSNIDSILYINIKEVYGTGFIAEGRFIMQLYELEIPPDATPGIMVYEIGFTVRHDSTTHIVDPYLRLPKQTLGK